MFDVGFLELAVIMILGLLVLGPERLPKVAQKAGYWLGKARRYVEGMKSQIEAEFDTAEVKRLLHNQEVQIRELQNKITDTGDAIRHDLKNDFDDDDPGSSHEEASAQSLESQKPAGPQYDILEEEMSWDEPEAEKSEPVKPDPIKSESMKSESIEKIQSDESAVSDKAQ